MPGVREFLIRILTRKEGTGARQAEKELAGVKDKAGGVQGKLREAEQAGQEFSDSTVGGLGRLMPKLAAGAAAVGAITFALREAGKALRAFSQQELSETDLDSALAVTGQLTERYRLQLQDLASEYQALTAIGDDAWLSSMAMLTRFGASAANIEDVAEAVKNLAGLLQGNLSAATMLIQRALEGQFEMFTRYGIQFQKTGDQAKDLANLFQLLAEKGGGLMEARAKTLTGMFTNLGNSLGDVREAMGRVISNTGAAQAAMGGLTKILRNVEAAIDPVHKVVEGLTLQLPDLSREARDAALGLKEIEEVDLSKVAQNAEQLAKSLQESASAAADVLSRADELADAQLALETAKIEEAVAHGAISEEEGKRRKLALQRAAADAQLQRHLDDINKRRSQALDELAKIEADRAAKAQDHSDKWGEWEAKVAAVREAGLATEQEAADLLSADKQKRQAAYDAITRRAAEADLKARKQLEQRRLDVEFPFVDVPGYAPKPDVAGAEARAKETAATLELARQLNEAAAAAIQSLDALTEATEDLNKAEDSVAAVTSELSHRERVLETQHAAATTRAQAQAHAVGAGEETARLKAELENLKKRLADAEARQKDLQETGPGRVARERAEAAAAQRELSAFESLPLRQQGRTPITRGRELRAIVERERAEAERASQELHDMAQTIVQTIEGLRTQIQNIQDQLKNTT